jgi:Predicted integral membrane protein (DUF2269)
MYRRLVKFLHEIGAIGVLGSLAACVVLVATAPADSTVAYAATRHGIAAVSRWLLVPSLLLVIVSGLLAIIATRPYMDAGWVWVKALLGISMFEGTLLTISASSRRAAELSAQAAAGQGDPALLAEVLRTEWGGLWILIAVSVANIALAVWRPRFGKRSD